MSTWIAAVPLLLLFGEVAAEAQTRSFSAGRLISREVRVTSNCLKASEIPPVVTLGPGLTFPIPQLAACDYTYPNGSAADPRPILRYTLFQIDNPAVTPAGAITPSGTTASIAFEKPFSTRISTSASWDLTPPVGQTVGQHTSTYESGVEGDSTSSCTGSGISTSNSGSLGFDTTCSVSRTAALWNSATQTGTMTVTTNIGFRYGNNNGSYNVIVRATYQITRLEVDHIEVLQTTQTPTNTVPLVAGKSALVRVFPVSSPGAAGPAQVRLRIYRDEELLQTLESGILPVAGGDPVRDDLDKSANFLLPAGLTWEGPVRLEAEVREPRGEYQGKVSQSIAFQSAPAWLPPYPVVAGALCNPVDACADTAAWTSAVERARFLLPAQKLSIYPIYLGPQTSAQALLTLFRARAAIEGETLAAAWPRQYIAYDPACAEGAACLLADPFLAAGQKKLSYVAGPPANLLACVVGANSGLSVQAASAGEPGWNGLGGSLLSGDTLDFMSCANADTAVSVSPDNAIRLFDVPAPATTDLPPALDISESQTLVTGVLRAGEGSVAFDPIYRIRGRNAIQTTQGPYCLRTTRGGAPIGSDVCFDIPPAEGDRPFATRMNLPTGAERLVFLANGSEIGSLARSTSSPTVNITSPEPNSASRYVRITWTATDPDSSTDPLPAQVWVSTDGAQSWSLAGLDITSGEFQLDTSPYAATATDGIYVQVRVSDGFNDASATSSLISLAPVPAIEPPAATPIRITDVRVNEGRILPVRVSNTGAGVLRITAVEASAASVSLAGDLLPFEVAPGQAANLPLYFAASEAGSQTATVTLRTNDPARPSVVVNLATSVYLQTGPVVNLNPAALDFGLVNTGSSSDQKIQVQNTGNQPLSITSTAITPPQVFRVVSAPTANVNPGASGEISVRCSPTAAYVTGTLTAATNDPTRPQLSIPVACTGVNPSLEVPRDVIDFGIVASGQSRTQQIIIRNITTRAINLTGANFSNAQFRLISPRLPFQISPESGAPLDIQFAPTLGGVATSTLTLNTDQAAVSAVINLRGTGTGSSQTNGRLSLEPTQLTFGELIINQSRTLPLTLRNTGTGLLTIASIASNNPVFAVTGVSMPIAIQVGSSVDVPIRFSPNATSAYTSVLTISSDSVTGSEILVNMNGIGLPIPATSVSNIAAPLRQDWTSRAFLTSLGPDDAILRFVRYDNAGSAVTDTGLTIPPGNQLRPDIDSGAGWAQVRLSKGSVEGYVQYTAQQAQTFDVMPLSPTLASRLIMMGLERGSDIILNNLISDNNSIVLELRTNNGALVGTQSVTLPSRASQTQRVEQLFANAPQGFQGYLIITASQALMATRGNNGATAMEASPAVPAPAEALRNVSLYAPRIQAGNGWLARLQVVNPTTRDAQITIRASASDGGAVGSPVQVVLPAGQAYWREFTQIFDLSGNVTWNAALTVESTVAGVVAEVAYGNSFARGAYAFKDGGARRSVIPSNTASTTFYILNPNAAAATVDLRNLLEDGTFGPARRITIQRGAYYGNLSGLTQSPAVRIESDLPVVAHAVITAEQVFDFGVLPAVNLDGASGGEPPAGTTPRLQVDPPALDFGNIQIGQNRVLTVSIRNGGTANLSVTSITSSNARFTVEANLPLTILPGVTQMASVRFTPNASGSQTGALTVSSNDTVTGPLTVSLNGSGVSVDTPKVKIEATPASIDFGDVNNGQTKDLLLTIRNLGTDPLIVNSIAMNNSRFSLVFASFPLTVGPSGLTTLQVRFSPVAPGAQIGTLTISSNDAANPTVNIALRGSGVGTASSPRIVVDVTNIEFGPVRIGETDERTFSIRNSGTAPLVIQTLATDTNIYTVGPAAPFTLAPNAIADVGVIFRPRDPANYPATLRIISNDPVNGTIIIPITGSGRN